MTKVHALIPARGGSKGIPRKNLFQIGGRPLISYTICAAHEAKIFDSIVVSSDDPEILQQSTAQGASALERPAHLSTDSCSADKVIEHFIQAKGLAANDVLIYLQPTSPLRNGKDIKLAYDLYQSSCPALLMSVFMPSHHPLKSFILGKDKMLHSLDGSDAPFSQRQSLPETFVPNGAIYIFSVQAFEKNKCIPRSGILPFMMSPNRSVDVDVPEDAELVEFFLAKEAKNATRV